MTKLVIVILIAIVIAAIARTKGYNPVLWFFIGAFMFPFSLLIVVLLPDRRASYSFKYKHSSNDNSSKTVTAPCSQCGRQIPINAAQCQFCGKKYDIIDTEAKKKDE